MLSIRSGWDMDQYFILLAWLGRGLNLWAWEASQGYYQVSHPVWFYISAHSPWSAILYLNFIHHANQTRWPNEESLKFDIRLRCWQHGLPMGQHYKITVSVHTHNQYLSWYDPRCCQDIKLQKPPNLIYSISRPWNGISLYSPADNYLLGLYELTPCMVISGQAQICLASKVWERKMCFV